MDLHQLYDFIWDENKPKEGLLQRFVMPFGINNCKSIKQSYFHILYNFLRYDPNRLG